MVVRLRTLFSAQKTLLRCLTCLCSVIDVLHWKQMLLLFRFLHVASSEAPKKLCHNHSLADPTIYPSNFDTLVLHELCCGPNTQLEIAILSSLLFV